MHWTRRILIAISLAVALLGVAIILLFTIDLGRFKGNLEDYVSEVSGRQFVIGGRFEPSIGELTFSGDALTLQSVVVSAGDCRYEWA